MLFTKNSLLCYFFITSFLGVLLLLLVIFLIIIKLDFVVTNTIITDIEILGQILSVNFAIHLLFLGFILFLGIISYTFLVFNFEMGKKTSIKKNYSIFVAFCTSTFCAYTQLLILEILEQVLLFIFSTF